MEKYIITTPMKITYSIAEYIEKNQARKNVRWRYFSGRLYFELFPGLWQHEKSFDKFFPIYEFKRNSNENPDGTYIK